MDLRQRVCLRRVTVPRGLQPAMQGFGWTPAPSSGNNLSMNIGKRLRELRKAKNLSQGDLERLAGFHRSYTSRVEGGHSVPALHTLERFAAALDLEMSQLFSEGGTGSPVPRLKGKVPHEREVKTLLGLAIRRGKLLHLHLFVCMSASASPVAVSART